MKWGTTLIGVRRSAILTHLSIRPGPRRRAAGRLVTEWGPVALDFTRAPGVGQRRGLSAPPRCPVGFRRRLPPPSRGASPAALPLAPRRPAAPPAGRPP